MAVDNRRSPEFNRTNGEGRDVPAEDIPNSDVPLSERLPSTGVYADLDTQTSNGLLVDGTRYKSPPNVHEAVVWEGDRAKTPERKGRKKLAAVFGVIGTLATAAATYSVLSSGPNEKSQEPKAPAETSAPLNPGVSEAPTLPPTQEAATNPADITATNVPITYNAESASGVKEIKLTGVKELKEKVVVSAAENPTVTTAIPVVVQRWNDQINFGNTPSQAHQYDGHTSSNGELYGLTAVMAEYVDPTFADALTGPAPEGTEISSPPSEVTKLLEDLHMQSLRNYGKDSNYKAQFTLDRPNITPSFTKDGVANVKIPLTFTDNATVPQNDKIIIDAAFYVNPEGNWTMIGSKITNNNG